MALEAVRGKLEQAFEKVLLDGVGFLMRLKENKYREHLTGQIQKAERKGNPEELKRLEGMLERRPNI